MNSPGQLAAPQRRLSLFDTTSIIVGIVIGASIYEASPGIARSAAGDIMNRAVGYGWASGDDHGRLELIGLAGLALVWIIGAAVALIGALCYAELATAYPEEGGTYAFLRRAFGRHVGFWFAWIEFWIIRPGNVGAVAYVFARYADELLPGKASIAGQMVLAVCPVLLLTILNVGGLRLGTWAQNGLSMIKVTGLAVIALVAVSLSPDAAPDAKTAPSLLPPDANLSLAMIFIMFAYGGWSDMSYVAAEVRDPERNLTRSLLLGTAVVATIYIALNLAFARGLGLAGFMNSEAVAARVLERPLGSAGSAAISVLICLSCLGAINGMIFTGARVSYAMGRDHRVFAWLGNWNDQRGVPLRSLVVQGAVTITLIVLFGFSKTGFERLVVFTGPFFWGFFALVALACIVLRWRDPATPRPFRVPLFPLTPLVFCLSSLLMTWAGVNYLTAQHEEGRLALDAAAWALLVLASGAVIILAASLSRRSASAQ